MISDILLNSYNIISSSYLSNVLPLVSFLSLSGVEVVVEYEYDALHDDELTLHLGDIIKNVRYIEEDGWMEGDLNGKRGLFPDNFVKVRSRCFDLRTYQLLGPIGR